jgi:hypothetical protein
MKNEIPGFVIRIFVISHTSGFRKRDQPDDFKNGITEIENKKGDGKRK